MQPEETKNNTNETQDNIHEAHANAENQSSAEETEKLKAEVGELKDKYLRLYSDFDNFRKRTMKEKADIIQSANKELLLALIPVLDDFDRAKKSFDATQDLDAQTLKEGIELIYNKIYKTLEQKGLKPMKNSIGETFDMDFHEAITHIPAASEDAKGKIVDEIEKGYCLGDKVIRFAKVVVGM